MSTIQITITTEDLDALTRIAWAESKTIASSLTGQGMSQEMADKIAYGTIVDSILNRVASDSPSIFGANIQDVINKNNGTTWQYEPVKNADGQVWQGLDVPPSSVYQAVQNHIIDRVSNGEGSLVGQATNYLNPTLATPLYDRDGNGVNDGWENWGQYMPEKVSVGDAFDSNGNLNDNVNSHVFGRATSLHPDPYSLSFDINGDGVIDVNETSSFDPLNPPFPQHKPEIGAPVCPVNDDWVSAVVNRVTTARTEASPLVLDLDNDGIELAALNGTGSVYWDIDNDGFAEASGWVGADDGLLAIDHNGDGIINSHSELFGTKTTDGFTALSAYDSNEDGMINANDDHFADLLVWQDVNSNGVSESTELYSLSALNITSINLNASLVDYDLAGNHVTHESSFTMNGQTRDIVDAWFAYDNVNTTYVGDYTLDIRTLFLPTLRGYGNLADLHIAMSLDTDLLDMVEEIATADMADLLDPSFDLETKFKDVLFQWAGVDTVDPSGRGGYIDGRALAFLEVFTDTPFEQRGRSNPAPEAGQTLENAFNDAYNALLSRVLVQSAGASLFTDMATYNPVSDEFDGTFTLDLTAVDTLIDGLGLSSSDLTAAWNSVIRLIDSTVGLSNLSTGDRATLETSVTDSDPLNTLTLQDVLDTIYDPVGLSLNGTTGDDTLIGGAGYDALWLDDGNDVSYGRAGNDKLYGNDGNDTLYGEEGHDVLYGEGDNDALYGGAGDDTLLGGSGDDTYYYESGFDTIVESSGVDTIVFDAQYAPAQIAVDFDPDNREDLNISIDGELAIRVEGYFESGKLIEYLSFDGGPVINLGDLTGFYEGGSGDDVLVGADNATFLHDILYGHDGNDTLTGGLGNDILNGGDGNDVYYVGSGVDMITDTGGTDRIVFGAGQNSTDASYDLDDEGNLTVSFNGVPAVIITNFLNSSNGIETLEFADSVTIAREDVPLAKNGTTGNDVMFGYSYLHDVLDGGAGDDRLYGYSGDDELIGGAGNDYLAGYTDNDTYIYSSGHDTIYDAGGSDVLEFEAGYTLNDLTFARYAGSLNDLHIEIDGSNSILLEDQLYSTVRGVETLRFADSSTLDLTTQQYVTHGTEGADTMTGIVYSGSINDIIYGYGGNDVIDGGNYGDDELYGGDGNDSLDGKYGNDLLVGGAGDDALEGGSGDDTYIYSSGHDTIYDSGDNDVLEFEAGYTLNDLTFARYAGSLNDLHIEIDGANSILLEDQLYSVYRGVETLRFADSSTLDLTTQQYVTYGTEGADTITGIAYSGSADDIIYGYGGNDVLDGGNYGDDELYGGEGNDVLDGGNYGNDLLVGGAGDDDLEGGYDNDTYIYSSGHDTIYDIGGSDVLEFEAGYTLNDLTFARYAGSLNDLHIEIDGSNSILLEDQLQSVYRGVETLRFADSSTLDLTTQQYVTYGTEGADTMTGIVYSGSINDIIYGNAGNDNINSAAGDDIISGGTGNDVLEGGYGNDTYLFARGDGADTVTNDASSSDTNDRLVFESGVDYDQIWFEQINTYDLKVSVIGTNDSVLFDDWYRRATDQVDTIESGDGYELTAGEVQSLVNAMASMTPPPFGQTELTAQEHTALDTTLASVWDQAA